MKIFFEMRAMLSIVRNSKNILFPQELYDARYLIAEAKNSDGGSFLRPESGICVISAGYSA